MPYLPVKAWQYSMQRYRQYIAEVAAVHLALEAALQLALSAPAVPQATAPCAEQCTTNSQPYNIKQQQQPPGTWLGCTGTRRSGAESILCAGVLRARQWAVTGGSSAGRSAGPVCCQCCWQCHTPATAAAQSQHSTGNTPQPECNSIREVSPAAWEGCCCGNGSSRSSSRSSRARQS
jgi:hypothetical protein